MEKMKKKKKLWNLNILKPPEFCCYHKCKPCSEICFEFVQYITGVFHLLRVFFGMCIHLYAYICISMTLVSVG